MADKKDKKNKKDNTSIKDIVEAITAKTAKRLPKSSGKKTSISDDVMAVTGPEEVKEILDDTNYMVHLMKHPEKMLDYSKLFSHFGKRIHGKYDSYDAYSYSDNGSLGDSEKYHETISNEAVNNIIEDSMVMNLCGFSMNRATVEEREAFKGYAMFNQSLVQLKYAIGL